MPTDIPDDLAELLVLWWLAERGAHRAAMGFPSECPSTRGYEAQRSRDLVVESQYRRIVIGAVAAAVDGLDTVHKAAAHTIARNLASGAAVWRSARLPANPDQQRQVFAETVARLCEVLCLTGVES